MAGEQAEQVSERTWEMGFDTVISEREQDTMVADSPLSPLPFRRVVPCCVPKRAAFRATSLYCIFSGAGRVVQCPCLFL